MRELTAASRAEPGCVSYVAHRVEAEPDTVLMYEQYRDEAALEEHRATAPFERFTASGPYQRMLDRKIERLVALGLKTLPKGACGADWCRTRDWEAIPLLW